MSEENKKLKRKETTSPPPLRDFKGIWIPREIWLREDISAAEKVLWAEIHSLYDRERGGCYASNEYLEEFNKVERRTLQRMISKLKSKGLIEQTSPNGKKRTLKALVPQEDMPETSKKRQKCHASHVKNDTHIIKSINKEKQHPLTPSSKSKITKVKKKVVVSSKNIKEREKTFLEKTKKKWVKEKRDPDLIEEVFKRYKSKIKEGIVYFPDRWIEGTFKKVLLEEEQKKEIKELIKLRKKFCKEHRERWHTGKNYVSTGYKEYSFDKDEEFWKKHKLSREHFEEFKALSKKKTNKKPKTIKENMFLLLLN